MILLQNHKGITIRGGKREGAGRKGYGKTKVYRLPIALEEEIKILLENYKKTYKEENKNKLDYVTKSIETIKPKYPVLNKSQLKRLRKLLINNNFAKSNTEARKKTNTPKLCKKMFLEYIGLTDNDKEFTEIKDIADLYYVINT